MSHVPDDLKYTASHEWIRAEGDGVYCIGVTEHAQELLGDMVFIDLPEIGMDVNIGDECAVVESVKAASDVYAPIDGVIVCINENLEEAPELVNSEPYGEGWLFRMKASDESQVAELLDDTDYLALLGD